MIYQVDYMGKIKKQKLAVLLIVALSISGLILWRAAPPIPSELEYRQRAQTLANAQDWLALEELTKHWADHYPDSGMLHAARADTMRVRGDFRGAAEEYRKAIEQDKNNPQLLAYFGIMLLENGDHSGARDACQRSVSILHQHADSWYCLALAHAELDDANATNLALAELALLRMEQLQIAQRVIREHICGRKKNIAKTGLCR